MPIQALEVLQLSITKHCLCKNEGPFIFKTLEAQKKPSTLQLCNDCPFCDKVGH